ncbi:LAME_0G19680g1_1 [Lachancea meyersii CBS 8951]|uniref:non-specific serine/threonine protein kinase n=1 Tax=Lachancea meyersii CBS 8951 TaxID=1266667 RepID=A0A1G4KC86_9SACH|nr:LAME_0G19680g1_1 [Lachancea meyersii CBS 8951]
MATRVNLTPAQKHSSSSGNTHHYALKQVVGKGAYGIVYRAVNRQTGKQVAIKVIEYDEEEELNEHMLEIDLLKNLKHENIVKYHGFIQKSHQLFILLEYCSQGSLRDLIKRGPVDENECRAYIKQTLHGLRYLHEQGVIHRDIKAANLLLDGHNVVKLADFGVSTRVNSLAMTYAGSPNWMAPEVMMGQGATTVSDIWSLGATVVEILTGNPPFHNLVNEAACYAIVHDVYLPPKSLSSTCRKFMRACFQKIVFQRPTAQDLLKYDWITEPHKPSLERFREGEESSEDWRHDFIEVEVSPFKENDVADAQQNLNRLRQPGGHFNPYLIFNECDVYSIATCLIDLCQRGQLKTVEEMMTYDSQYKGGECKNMFITLGGIPALLSNIGLAEAVLSQFFIEDVKELIKCGILPYCGSIANVHLVLAVVAAYGAIVDFETWCQWCCKLPNIEDVIVKGLEADDRLAHDTLLSLSDANFPMKESLIARLMTLPLTLNKRLTYTVFKSLNSFLERKSVGSIDPDYAETESSTLEPQVTFSSPRFANLSAYSERRLLPEGFIDWLLKFTPNASEDQHLVKNFIELCFNAGHLDRVVLGEIVEHGGFLQLTQNLIQRFVGDSRTRYKKSMLSIALNLCVELSQEVNVTYLPTAVDVALGFLGIPDFITGGTEILMHCFLFAMHENCAITEDSLNILINCRTETVTIPRVTLLRTFYSEEPKFGNYITKFSRLCSLPPCKSLAFDIVSHPHFMRKTKALFDVYRSSLIIQIDFLKFLKLILTRYTEFAPRSVRKDIPTNLLISTAMQTNFVVGDCQVLSDVIEFLLSNWRPDNLRPNQVGGDSVLIKQLCRDIELLKNTTHSNDTKRLERNGLSIPAPVPSFP